MKKLMQCTIVTVVALAAISVPSVARSDGGGPYTGMIHPADGVCYTCTWICNCHPKPKKETD